MFANVNVSDAASNEVIAAVAGKSIRILGLQLIAAGDVTVTLEDEDGTNLMGPMALAINGGFVFPPSADVPVVHTRNCYCHAAPGKAVHLLLSAAVQVGGAIQYST